MFAVNGSRQVRKSLVSSYGGRERKKKRERERERESEREREAEA